MKTMNTEVERYKTYERLRWPESIPVETRDLAAAGLYYTGKEDTVACFICGGCLKNWETGDDPFEEHKRIFPNCPFIRGWYNTNVHQENNHVDSIATAIPTHPPPDILVPSKLGIPASGRLIHPLDIVTASKPTPDVVRTCQHPRYAMENQRLESFRQWPLRSSVKPMLLARAGFFYSGEGDKVTCFYCGGALQRWDSQDDPWVEHAKAFGRCEWLMQQKGPYFLQHVVGTS